MNGKDEILLCLRKYKANHGQQYNINRMGLFGSVARNEMNENSDVDIVVELEKADLFYLIGIKQDLEEQLHRKVDIIRYTAGMNNFLKRRIDKDAVYV